MEATLKSDAPRILEWAREIQALAQTEFHYADDDFQRQRCRRLTEIAAEMISQSSGVQLELLAKAFNSQIGYATPKIDVRAAVFDDGKLLFVREKIDGGWTMPGGWVDVGNVPSEAAERETLEESGFQVKARKVIGVYDGNRMAPLEVFHAFKIIFLCELLGGTACPSNETTEIRFFGPDELPSQLSGERTKTRHIRDAFHALSHPGSATVFD
jgi:ADP-ribose pyrophosphatase YjhB (NUDIX family)